MAAASSRQETPTQHLAIKDLFEALSPREQLYAHHLSQAAWNGTRIILRQTSPEGTGIFDFVLALHKACGGQWGSLVDRQGVDPSDLTAFLEFAGLFLSNLGNYFGEGDQKIVPPISRDSLVKMANSSPEATAALERIIEPLLSPLSSSLGFPDENNQSNYYPGTEKITRDEIAAVAKVMEGNSIEPENTRIRKHTLGQPPSFDVLQASSEPAAGTRDFVGSAAGIDVRLEPGDHADELSRTCFHLSKAANYVSNPTQAEFLANCVKCFRSGDLEAYRAARKPLAFCSSYIWEAVNLPNYSDIRETCGSKNIVFANRMSLNSSRNRPCYFVRPTEVDNFRAYNHVIRFIVTAIHEVLGHGTGKLLTEVSAGKYNFDKESMPINPLTGQPVETWYRPGQTWTSVFEKLATSVEECRAMLVSYYLADNKEVMSVFGYTDSSTISADDLIYYTYLHVGVEGIQALRTFNARDMVWGQPHARANFAILKHLLLDGGGVITVKHDEKTETVEVSVDRSKVSSHGRPSLGRMLRCIHIWRCIADVESCKRFYEPLSAVNGDYETWRRIVVSKPEPGWKFVQPNTVLKDDGGVELVLYEESNRGIIQSFADRRL